MHQATSYLERGLSLCRAGDFPGWYGLLVSFLGPAFLLAGQATEAVPLLEQAVEQATARSIRTHLARLVAGLSEAYLLEKRDVDALQLAQSSLQIAQDQKARDSEARTLCLLGDIAARCEPPESAPAETHYHQSLALAEELGMRPLVAHCHHGLGTLYAATGQREQARAALATAITLYRAMDMTFWLPQVEAALPQVEAR